MKYYAKSYTKKTPVYKKLLWPLIIFWVVFGSWLFLIRQTQNTEAKEYVSPVTANKQQDTLTPEPTKSAPKKTPTPKIVLKNKLNEVVSPYLNQEKINLAVAIKNLKTGEIFYANEHTKMQTASLYKLWVMAATYEQIWKGKLTEDQVLSENISTLNNRFSIDEEDAELTSGSITLSVKQALTRMITLSDNYSALLLTEKIGLSTVDNFLKESGLNESNVGTSSQPPQATASDIALFFEKLYSGDLNQPKYSLEMLELLKNQKKNNKLPKYLADSVIIAHKTGELNTFSHDAGVVFLPTGDYVIAVMTDSPNPATAEDQIGKLSKDIYNYFYQNN